MKNCLSIIFFSLILSFPSQAKHQYEEYSIWAFWNYLIEGSENYYQFQSDLIQDKDVIKEIKNNKKTHLVSYLLFEDDKIKIDEHDLPS